jgi:hypothetical protein
MIHISTLIGLLLTAGGPPRVDWPMLFSRISVTGAQFSAKAKALDGKRVVVRGNGVPEPRPEGGVFLTRGATGRLHPDDEETLPWDAGAALWRKGLDVREVPARPSIEGTLRLGNRRIGSETVVFVLEDAVPFVEDEARGVDAR